MAIAVHVTEHSIHLPACLTCVANISHYDPAMNEMKKALQLAQSSGASQDVIQCLQAAFNLVDMKEDFTNHATSKQSAVCAGIFEKTYSHDWPAVHAQGKTTLNLKPKMMTGPLESQFLKFLISMQKPKRILELGMYTGYSSLSMAEALPADGELVTIDLNEYLKTFVTDLMKDSPHSKKIKVLIGNANDLLKQMVADGETFDMMFFDSEQSGYLTYLKYAFECNLLSPGGTLLVDNAYMNGTGYIPSANPSNIKIFTEAVAADSSLHSVLVPIRDGVLMIRRMSDVEGPVA